MASALSMTFTNDFPKSVQLHRIKGVEKHFTTRNMGYNSAERAKLHRDKCGH